MSVLVINSGSSSIKYQLVGPDTGEAVATGLVERIGEENGLIRHAYGDRVREIEGPVADHGVGLETAIGLFEEIGPSLTDGAIRAVGHRIVQGGKYFDGPALVDDAVQAKIEELCPLAPLHNPAHLKGIVVARRLLPDVPHVVVFDTAFFQSLPDEAAVYALDRDIADRYEVRRYGAHGTSHHYVSGRVADILGRDDLKQIVLHLGNGASVSAVESGRAVETSMGLTPLEGLVMGTRTGDIDPAVVFHLARVGGMSIDELDTLFNRGSGLKGLTGENDMRLVRSMAAAGDERGDHGGLGRHHLHRGRRGERRRSAGGRHRAARALRREDQPGAQRGQIEGAAHTVDRGFAGRCAGGADQRGAGHRPPGHEPGVTPSRAAASTDRDNSERTA